MTQLFADDGTVTPVTVVEAGPCVVTQLRTHGSMNYRRPGAIGCSAYPARVFKGKRMGGHYGAKRKTMKNLEVMRVDGARNLLLIKGSLPGHNGSFVQVQTARTGVKK